MLHVTNISASLQTLLQPVSLSVYLYACLSVCLSLCMPSWMNSCYNHHPAHHAVHSPRAGSWRQAANRSDKTNTHRYTQIQILYSNVQDWRRKHNKYMRCSWWFLRWTDLKHLTWEIQEVQQHCVCVCFVRLSMGICSRSKMTQTHTLF